MEYTFFKGLFVIVLYCCSYIHCHYFSSAIIDNEINKRKVQRHSVFCILCICKFSQRERIIIFLTHWYLPISKAQVSDSVLMRKNSRGASIRQHESTVLISGALALKCSLKSTFWPWSPESLWSLDVSSSLRDARSSADACSHPPWYISES